MPASAKQIAWAKRREQMQNRMRSGPVILPRAIQAFCNREVNSYYWMKGVPKDELLKTLLMPELFKKKHTFGFHTPPWTHQLACTLIATTLDQFLFFLDMGSGGKTKITLDTLWYRKCTKSLGKTLVLVPSDMNILSWLDEVQIHRPEFKAVGLRGSKSERLELIEQDADLYVLNYEGLMSYITTLGSGEGRSIDHVRARAFAGLFDAMVLDECHGVGNRSSLRFRMVDALRKRIPLFYGLTGTPFGGDPEKMWAQFYLADRGETLGQTLGLFRAAFFDSKVNYFGGLDHTFNEKHTDNLRRLMANRSIRYEESELTDVPNVQRHVHRVTFGEDAEDYYARVRTEFFAAKGNLQEQRNNFIRMRQACAGFLSAVKVDEDGEATDERTVVPFYSNPKLDALETLVDGLPPDEKVIVFHEFVPTGAAICDMLTRKKIKWARVGGEKSNPGAALRKFLDDPKCTYLVANNHSGATTGINPQKVCRREVFYDSPVSPIVRKQAEKRVNRPGQTKKVHIHDLVVAGSVDVSVLASIKAGEDLFQAIVNGKKVKL